LAFVVLYAPALWASLALVLNHHTFGRFVAGLVAVPACPGVLWVGTRALGSVPRHRMARIMIVLACGDATLVASIYAFLVFLRPQH